MAPVNCTCKYSVVVNMPGYMPDSDPMCYRTLADARACAQYEIARFREDEYVVHGNARTRSWYAYPSKARGGSDFHIGIYDVDPADMAHDCECDECRYSD